MSAAAKPMALGMVETKGLVGSIEAGDAMVKAASDLGIPVSVVDITDPRVRDAYGADLVLVRPDQHIAWRADTEPTAPTSVWKRITGHP